MRLRSLLTQRRVAAAGAITCILVLVIVVLLLGRSGSRVRTASGEPVRAAALDIGAGHGCATEAENVWCWGRNDNGQRGDADNAASSRALPLVQQDSVLSVAAGISHTCTLLTRGAVHCWGGNFAGQLGDRSLQDRTSPREVRAAEPFDGISTLAYHTCAVTRSGRLYCWGNDTDGQLGVGSPVATCRWGEQRFHCSDRPESVGARRWRAVSAGGSHSCAIDQDGAVYCWGSNRAGQLGAATSAQCTGDGGAHACSRRPLAVKGLESPVTSIAAGAAHTCALDGDGRAYCWGSNLNGQSGSADTAQIVAATLVSTTLRFTAIAAGGRHTCAITEAGALYCWGRDSAGELRRQGRDRCAGLAWARVPIPLARRGESEVRASFGRTCMRRVNGDVLCWGNGEPDVLPPQREMSGRFARTHGLQRVIGELRWYGAAVKRFVYRQAARLEQP
jgi:alpha-tubulin suppressor-like RCC1 family protein